MCVVVFGVVVVGVVCVMLLVVVMLFLWFIDVAGCVVGLLVVCRW